MRVLAGCKARTNFQLRIVDIQVLGIGTGRTAAVKAWFQFVEDDRRFSFWKMSFDFIGWLIYYSFFK